MGLQHSQKVGMAGLRMRLLVLLIFVGFVGFASSTFEEEEKSEKGDHEPTTKDSLWTSI